ncbi:hypothetical protein HID58_072891 [Brassica napus]|uniref:BED-type domain-containing protein n=1 Tax=Brassica napus TaxID=3708 RepID=A0ABQ7Z5X3_BRANA|nr:hypothetical protein HID58_072891 [Brassica napus]
MTRFLGENLMIINEMDLSDAVIVKSSKLKSAVWNDFDKVRKGEIHVAICRHCKKRLSGSSASGTSHLRNHLIRCKRRASSNETPLELAIVDQTKHEHNASVINSGLDQRRSRFDLARMIILHGYPLTMVEDVGFRVFLRNLQPLFEPVVFERVESDCMEIYAKEKHKIFEDLDKLPGKISISVDVWNGGASDDSDEFLCLAAHYIDDTWELRKRVLNFFMVDPSHTDVMLAEVVITCLMEWDIDRKLFSMASNRTPPFGENVADKIRDRLSQNKFLYCNGQLFDVSCGVYVINQMAQESLQACFETVDKIRESVRYVKSSEFIQESFDERDLCIDDSARWDTTSTMLEIALEQKNVFSLMKQRDPDSCVSCPSDLEWERLETVVGFLRVFVEVTNTFTKSSNSCLTANIYFPEICDIHLRLIEWTKRPDGFISSLALTMRKRFNEFWNRNHRVLAIATILDPRFKMKLVEYYYPLFYDSNLEKYLEEPLFPRNSDFDILNWWKVHTAKYPILSMVARNVLAVPMSNVSPEEDPFESSRKRRISETWCSLRPSTVQALMCAQDWIRSELESS